MKLPLCEQAEISMDKLIGYCLNPNHPTVVRSPKAGTLPQSRT